MLSVIFFVWTSYINYNQYCLKAHIFSSIQLCAQEMKLMRKKRRIYFHSYFEHVLDGKISFCFVFVHVILLPSTYYVCCALLCCVWLYPISLNSIPLPYFILLVVMSVQRRDTNYEKYHRWALWPAISFIFVSKIDTFDFVDTQKVTHLFH